MLHLIERIEFSKRAVILVVRKQDLGISWGFEEACYRPLIKVSAIAAEIQM